MIMARFEARHEPSSLRQAESLKFRQPAGSVSCLHHRGRECRHRVKSMDKAQGSANQGIESLAKHFVGHPGTAK